MGTTKSKVKSMTTNNPCINIQANGLDQIMQKYTDQNIALCKYAWTKMSMRLHIQYLIG